VAYIVEKTTIDHYSWAVLVGHQTFKKILKVSNGILRWNRNPSSSTRAKVCL